MTYSQTIEKEESIKHEIVCPHCKEEFEVEANATAEVEDVDILLQVNSVDPL